MISVSGPETDPTSQFLGGGFVYPSQKINMRVIFVEAILRPVEAILRPVEAILNFVEAKLSYVEAIFNLLKIKSTHRFHLDLEFDNHVSKCFIHWFIFFKTGFK